jgi:glucosyl-dolichyl phosphate glucuronosyltransferase
VRLSVVICTYTQQRWEDLVAAVSSVQCQEPAVHEVIVVVDHDDALLVRARRELAGADVVSSAGPRGLSGARNTGWQRATGEVVAFLDDDARADQGWAAAMLSAYEDETVVGVGGAVLPDWRAPRPPWFPEEFLWVVGCGYRGQPAGRARVRNGIGANVSFRREVLAGTGGFQTGLGRLGADGAGCEETELSIRAHRTRPGARVLLEPAAVVRHAVGPERTNRAYFRRRCAAEGRSKALVAAIAGPGPALLSERRYVSTVLPTGVLAGLAALARGDLDAGRRSLAIVEGLVRTTIAYAVVRARLSTSSAAARPLHEGPAWRRSEIDPAGVVDQGQGP